MRVAVCGPERAAGISKIEDALKVAAKKAESNDIIALAAETYKYQDESMTVFEGSAFDCLAGDLKEGYGEVYEQIALDTLVNLDYIVVLTMNMDKDTLEMYQSYASLYPKKFYFYTSYVDMEIAMR